MAEREPYGQQTPRGSCSDGLPWLLLQRRVARAWLSRRSKGPRTPRGIARSPGAGTGPAAAGHEHALQTNPALPPSCCAAAQAKLAKGGGSPHRRPAAVADCSWPRHRCNAPATPLLRSKAHRFCSDVADTGLYQHLRKVRMERRCLHPRSRQGQEPRPGLAAVEMDPRAGPAEIATSALQIAPQASGLGRADRQG